MPMRSLRLIGGMASVLGNPAPVFLLLLLFTMFGWMAQVETNVHRPVPIWLFLALLCVVAAARLGFFLRTLKPRSANGRQLLERAYWQAELIYFGGLPFTLLFLAGVEGNVMGFLVFPLFMVMAVGCTLLRRRLLSRNVAAAYDAGALK